MEGESRLWARGIMGKRMINSTLAMVPRALKNEKFADRELLLPLAVINRVPRHSEESHFRIFKMPPPGFLDPDKTRNQT